MSLDREVYSLREVGQLLDVSMSTLYRWIRQRRFVAYKPGDGQQYRVTRAQVARLLGRDAVPPTAPEGAQS